MTVKVWLFIKKTSGEPVTLRYQLAPCFLRRRIIYSLYSRSIIEIIPMCIVRLVSFDIGHLSNFGEAISPLISRFSHSRKASINNWGESILLAKKSAPRERTCCRTSGWALIEMIIRFSERRRMALSKSVCSNPGRPQSSNKTSGFKEIILASTSPASTALPTVFHPCCS